MSLRLEALLTDLASRLMNRPAAEEQQDEIARANTTVELTAPIPLTSSVDQTGNYLGLGLTGAFGIKR